MAMNGGNTVSDGFVRHEYDVQRNFKAQVKKWAQYGFGVYTRYEG